jgi:hypothetical protein
LPIGSLNIAKILTESVFVENASGWIGFRLIPKSTGVRANFVSQQNLLLRIQAKLQLEIHQRNATALKEF